MLALGPEVMTCSDQKLVTAGPTEPMSCNISSQIQAEEKYTTDATEADSCIWKHYQQSDYTMHYIFSPDTDTYLIGLTNHKQGADTYVDLTTVG